MYLLDTTHCCKIINGDQKIAGKLSSLGSETVATCVIVQGELTYGALKSKHIEQNLLLVKQFLEALYVYPVDGETAEIYGRLKAEIMERFGPRDRNRRGSFPIHKLGFTDNDLWIAAVALRHKLIVVSGDTDFSRIKGIMNLNVEKWIS